MSYRSPVYLTLPVLAVVIGGGTLGPAVAQTSVYAVQPPGQQVQNVVVLAPIAPPAPMIETPPPPPIGSREAYWRPGHWNWNGASWVWSAGTYVMPPRSSVVWVPGQWVVQATGGYAWVNGHWQE